MEVSRGGVELSWVVCRERPRRPGSVGVGCPVGRAVWGGRLGVASGVVR